MPLVSIVVTTYNREKLLTQTLHSILNQSFQDFELIVIDNFSKYNFFECIKSFNNEKIKAFQNQNNGIIAVNRNFGIKQARGRYVAFCDDDDIWLKDKLEKQVTYAKEIPNTIVSTYREIIDDDNNFIRLENWSYNKRYSIYYRNKIALSSVLVELTEEIYFDTRKEYYAMEDYALWLKLFHLGYGIHFIPKPLIQYREGRTSNGRDYTFLPPKEIACLSEMVIMYKEQASMFHYIFAVLKKIYYFTKYLVRNKLR